MPPLRRKLGYNTFQCYGAPKTEQEKIAEKFLDDNQNHHGVYDATKEYLKKHLTKEDLNNDPFKEEGGYTRINKIFEGNVDAVLQTLNDNLYSEGA